MTNKEVLQGNKNDESPNLKLKSEIFHKSLLLRTNLGRKRIPNINFHCKKIIDCIKLLAIKEFKLKSYYLIKKNSIIKY